MSEFVECQNCGRSFFAENLDCPYCGRDASDDDAETMVVDLMRTVAPSTPAPRPAASGLLTVVFNAFAVITATIAGLALWGLARSRSGAGRAWLVLELGLAVATLVGVVGRRRWGRGAAITFILCTVGLGLGPLAGSNPILIWAPGPLVLLLFIWPFLGAAARDRFTR